MGRPVQLVRLDEEGGLTLDKGALSCCLEQGGVADAPVCLVSIVGEQRRGKSFLMNYLMRRLRSLDMSDGSWMGQEEEPLEGFEWRVGNQRVTQGVWAWTQPFWVPTEGGKVAVLLVDTEGSMDLERNKETSIKLSAMSMLLSSYQILNIGHRVKDPDLEYLEMFLHVAEVVGEAYGLEPIQHLDLLVRDWSSSLVFGAEGGEQHLGDVRQMLEATSPCKHPKALEALSRSSTSSYLMPFPGKRISTGSVGTLRDMDEDFRDSLRDYVTALVGSAGQHVRTDRHGALLTGTQLAAKIKNLSDVMKKHRSGFSSPCQMAIAFHNQRALDRASADHAEFLREKDGLSQHMVDCLKMDPGAMAEQFEEQLRSLLGRCQEEMKEPEKETLLTALEKELTQKAKTFLETYRERHECHTINQRAMDRAHTDHTAFLKEKDGLSQRMVDCLTMDPGSMVKQLAEQRRSLLGRCREEMKEPEETLLMVVEVELTREAETFLEIYRERYECHAINQRAMDRARRDHAAFLKEKDGLSQRMVDCLTVDPGAMAQQLEEQRRSLLERCREEMEEPEENLLMALKLELTQEAETLLETYRRRYQCHTINQGAMDRARADHADFLREKDGLSQRMVDCLTVDPGAMAEQFEEQHRSLLGRCREEMEEPEETLLTALEAELTQETETFLETYRRRHQCHVINQGAMDSARRDHTAFLREKDGLSQRMVDCLTVDPSAMAQELVEQHRSLLGQCREEMKEPEETLLRALEKELAMEAQSFLETYRRRYQSHAINQGAMNSARRDHADFLKEKDGLSQRMVDCLTVDPGAMAEQFEEHLRSLLGRCREEMKEPEETLLMMLEVELTQEAKAFLETYRRRYRCHTINQRVMDRARQDHTEFLKEKDGLSQRMADCLKVGPSAMVEQFVKHRTLLLERCQKEMKEQEKKTLLKALEEELTAKAKSFLETYRKRYECHTFNQSVMDRARRDHAMFLREKDGLSQRMVDCLKVGPSAMAEQLEEQRRSLLGRCQKEMKELEKKTLLKALEEELTGKAKTFLETYGGRYECHTFNQRVMDRARRDHTAFLKKKDGLSQRMVDCLKVDPSAMEVQLEEQCRSLLEQCQKAMKEPEETLLMALEEELTREAETFLETYTRRYQYHAFNQRIMHRACQDYAVFLKKSNMFTSSEKLVAQRRQLLKRCREEMLPKTESLLMVPDAALMQEKEDLLSKLEAELIWMAEPVKKVNGKYMKMVIGAVTSGVTGVITVGGAMIAGAGILPAAGVGVLTTASTGIVATVWAILS